MPRAAFLDFLNSTVLGSDWVRKRTPDLLALDWTPTFTTELLRKDFDLGLAAARQHEVTMPLAGNVFQLLQAAIGRGYPRRRLPLAVRGRGGLLRHGRPALPVSER